MKKIYMTIDFGSTYTKLTAIDIDEKEILATSRAMTTIKTDVTLGYKEAEKIIFNDLDKKIGKNNYEIIKRVACSSAAGGLNIVAIGLVPELTTEAAKKAALSSGARVMKTYGFFLDENKIEELRKTDYDIILLTGGTNGGNREYILENASILAKSNLNKPIVVAGNEEAKGEIVDIFEKNGIEYYLTENVMPVVNKINVEPVREIIRMVFMKNIVKAKGMENVQKIVGNIIMPTPTAVLKAAEVFFEFQNEDKDKSSLLVIDIGGATTDVHSIGKGLPDNNSVQIKGMEEPYSKRTVEGDLGMRYSAMALYEATTLNKIRTHLGTKDSKVDIRENFIYRQNNPQFVSEIQEDVEFDEMMAKICVEIAINRHVGILECVYSPMGTIFAQSGKDLRNAKYVIGTGGAIINSRNPIKILEQSLFEEDTLMLKPKYPKFLVDKKYIMSSMGLLGNDYRDVAYEIMKKYLIEV